MTRRDHEPGTPGPTDMTSVPSAAELDETDRYLDRLAAGGSARPADAGGALLSSAAAPGEEPELAGASAFTAALADSVDERRALADEPRTINVLGRVIAAKVVVIAAVAALGIAGAGAATGVILQSVDRETPSTTAPEPTDDLVPGASDSEGASGRRAASSNDVPNLSVAVATQRVAVCEAATTDVGRAELTRTAEELGATPAEFCQEAAAALEAALAEGEERSGAEDDTAGGTTDGTDDGTTGSPGSSDAAGSTPSDNGANNGNAPQAGGNPTPGNTPTNNGNAPQAGGNPTPGNTPTNNGDAARAGTANSPADPNSTSNSRANGGTATGRAAEGGSRNGAEDGPGGAPGTDGPRPATGPPRLPG